MVHEHAVSLLLGLHNTFVGSTEAMEASAGVGLEPAASGSSRPPKRAAAQAALKFQSDFQANLSDNFDSGSDRSEPDEPPYEEKAKGDETASDAGSEDI